MYTAIYAFALIFVPLLLVVLVGLATWAGDRTPPTTDAPPPQSTKED